MLILIVGSEKQKRAVELQKVLKEFQTGIHENLRFNDSAITLADLERYAYPSLFSIGQSIVCAQFLLDATAEDITDEFIKKLVQSPTLFILEEYTLAASLRKQFEKVGTQIHIIEEKKIAKKMSPLFATATALCTGDKKTAWLALQTALQSESAEALIGIVYWKLRDMQKTKKNMQLEKLYSTLIDAHATAWQIGIPLALAIEKVILQK